MNDINDIQACDSEDNDSYVPEQEDPTRHDLPSDYEPCGECGFDHSYEQEEAQESHRRHEEMMKESRTIMYEASTGKWVRLVYEASTGKWVRR